MLPARTARVDANATSPLQSWQLAWREGFLPCITDQGLLALKTALENDDPRLIQGATTEPLPLNCRAEKPPLGACPVALTAWLGDGMARVGEIEEFFAKTCIDADFYLNEPAGCRRFLNWVDSTPRAEMRQQLLVEVLIALTARGFGDRKQAA